MKIRFHDFVSIKPPKKPIGPKTSELPDREPSLLDKRFAAARIFLEAMRDRVVVNQ